MKTSLKTGVKNIAKDLLTLGAEDISNAWGYAAYQARLNNFVRNVDQAGLLNTLEDYTASFLTSTGAQGIYNAGLITIKNAINRIKIQKQQPDYIQPSVSLTDVNMGSYLRVNPATGLLETVTGEDFHVLGEGTGDDVVITVDTGIEEENTQAEENTMYRDSRVFMDRSKVSKVFGKGEASQEYIDVLEYRINTMKMSVRIKDSSLLNIFDNFFMPMAFAEENQHRMYLEDMTIQNTSCPHLGQSQPNLNKQLPLSKQCSEMTQ